MLRRSYKKMPLSIRKLIDPILNLTRFYYNYYVSMPDFPKSVNLSLSSACQAKCIFCPPQRGKYIKPKHMSLQLAAKIFDELATHDFQGHINPGENGEAVLNPHFIQIFKYMHTKLPNISSQLISNMNRFDESIAMRTLEIGFNEMHFNIDGASKGTYEYAKGLSFETMKNNVTTFFKIRDKLGSKCKVFINIVTAAKYLKAISKENSDIPDDAEQIISYWTPFLRDGDEIREQRPFLWAERDELKIPNRIGCALLSRVVNELFVAPNGDCYLCCLDDNAKITLGNLNNSSIAEIWKSKTRYVILRNLYLKHFQILGEPCSICLY